MGAQAMYLRDDEAQINNRNAQLSTADEIPSGGYAAFQANLVQSLNGEDNVKAASVDCILPSMWVPGTRFNCDAFDTNGNNLGGATVTIESNDPDGQISREFNWAPAGSD
jgi:hypothetical protein